VFQPKLPSNFVLHLIEL